MAKPALRRGLPVLLSSLYTADVHGTEDNIYLVYISYIYGWQREYCTRSPRILLDIVPKLSKYRSITYLYTYIELKIVRYFDNENDKTITITMR